MTGALSDHSAPKSRRSVALLFLARGLRGFGDGFAVIVLPAYLSALGYDPIAIGLVATASLLGTALLTLAVGVVAPRFDLRTLLLWGAGVVTATGLAFPAASNLMLIAIVAFIGTINPSSGDLGMLVPLEHAMLARGADDRERTKVFARYSLIGALTMAAGSLAASLPDWLVAAGYGRLGALRLMFLIYAGLGLVSALLYRQLPHARAEERHHAPLGPSRGTV
jgi:MFS family permease